MRRKSSGWMKNDMIALISILRKLRFTLHTPGVGPYKDSWGVTIYDRVTDDVLVSLCLTSDGWCLVPFNFGAGMYRRGTKYDRVTQIWK